MALGQQTEKVLDYLRENPECTATEIGLYLGTTRNHATSILYGLRRRGLAQAIEAKNGAHRLVFVATHHADPTEAVIARAREIGGPFGILAAQVTYQQQQ